VQALAQVEAKAKHEALVA
jgi:hypothetical protein